MKKNDHIRLKITDMGVNGEGIGKLDGFTYFVKDAVCGDEAEAVVTKVNEGYAFAKALNITVPSPFRTEPLCPDAQRCGGCQIMQLDYKEQLRFKENKVKNNLKRIGGCTDYIFRPIIGTEADGSGIPAHYRNKTQYPIGRSRDGHVITGFYAGRTHYIVESEDCPIAPEENAGILKAVRSFIEREGLSVYDEETGKGLVRHVLIRNGFATGQIMVCLVINGFSLAADSAAGCENAAEDENTPEKRFVRDLLTVQPRIASICLNINRAKTNVILGDTCINLYGTDYIEDKIGGLTFRISPLSFFQVNSIQTEKLYGKALEYAGLSGREVVWDLYCGTGTISLFLAQKAGKVYGVEIIQAAIDNAKDNAVRNGVDNAEFFCGKSEEIFPELVKKHPEMKPDVVVVDPPRKGCDKKLLEAIMETGPERIVYVSCDSATLARDVKILSEKYKLKEATPVDMFPHTVHVETVALLTRLNPRGELCSPELCCEK